MTSRPLTVERFSDLDAVFGERGVARQCFCMYWRRPDGGYGDDRDNRDRYRDIVAATPRPTGLIGYIDDRPLGWVQVGPREEFPSLYRSRNLRPPDDVPAWSINCFVVATGNRKRGIGQGLLDAAIAFAADSGAPVVEAYPVDGPGSAVGYFTGKMSMFTERGFTEVARRNETRPIVRLTL